MEYNSFPWLKKTALVSIGPPISPVLCRNEKVPSAEQSGSTVILPHTAFPGNVNPPTDSYNLPSSLE